MYNALIFVAVLVSAQAQYSCSCAPGFSGSLCQTNIDECASAPCQNGGTCQDQVNGYTCDCVPGFSGPICQTNINECLSTPCANGGTCVDDVNSHICTCPPGYSGLRCQTQINECTSQPCRNGGTCIDGINSYGCTCTAGYSGVLCQTNVDECASNPCANGGTCIDGVNGFSCDCVAETLDLTQYCAVRYEFCGDHYMQTAGSTGSFPILSQNPQADTTTSFWVRLHTEIGSPGPYNLLSATDLVYDVYHISVDAYGPGAHLQLRKEGGGTCSSTATFDSTQWHHIGWVYDVDSPSSDVYLDGQLVINDCTESSLYSAIDFTAAAGGAFDEFAHYESLALSASQIYQLYLELDPSGDANAYRINYYPFTNGDPCDTTNGCVTSAVYDSIEFCTGPGTSCDSMPCAHGGTCVNNYPLSFTCYCVPGASGAACEAFDACYSNPCQNDGVCHNGVDSYVCECAAGTAGTNCEDVHCTFFNPDGLHPGDGGYSVSSYTVTRTSSTTVPNNRITLWARAMMGAGTTTLTSSGMQTSIVWAQVTKASDATALGQLQMNQHRSGDDVVLECRFVLDVNGATFSKTATVTNGATAATTEARMGCTFHTGVANNMSINAWINGQFGGGPSGSGYAQGVIPGGVFTFGGNYVSVMHIADGTRGLLTSATRRQYSDSIQEVQLWYGADMNLAARYEDLSNGFTLSSPGTFEVYIMLAYSEVDGDPPTLLDTEGTAETISGNTVGNYPYSDVCPSSVNLGLY
jgi:hypothetical protein